MRTCQAHRPGEPAPPGWPLRVPVAAPARFQAQLPAPSRHPSTFSQQSSSVEEGPGQGKGDLELLPLPLPLPLLLEERGGGGGGAEAGALAGGVGGPCATGCGGTLSAAAATKRPLCSPALSATKSLKLAKSASP